MLIGGINKESYEKVNLPLNVCKYPRKYLLLEISDYLAGSEHLKSFANIVGTRNNDHRDMKNVNSVQASNNTIYFLQKKTKFAKKLKVATNSSFSFEACYMELNDANPLKCSSCTYLLRVSMCAWKTVVISRRLPIKILKTCERLNVCSAVCMKLCGNII